MFGFFFAIFAGGLLGGALCHELNWPLIAGALVGGSFGAFMFKTDEIIRDIKQCFVYCFEVRRWKIWWRRYKVIKKINGMCANILAITTVGTVVSILVVGILLLLPEEGRISSTSEYVDTIAICFTFVLFFYMVTVISNVLEEGESAFEAISSCNPWVWNPIVGTVIGYCFLFYLVIEVIYWILTTAIPCLLKSVIWTAVRIPGFLKMVAYKIDTNERRVVFSSSALGVMAGYPFGIALVSGIYAVAIGAAIVVLSKLIVKYTPELAKA